MFKIKPFPEPNTWIPVLFFFITPATLSQEKPIFGGAVIPKSSSSAPTHPAAAYTGNKLDGSHRLRQKRAERSHVCFALYY